MGKRMSLHAKEREVNNTSNQSRPKETGGCGAVLCYLANLNVSRKEMEVFAFTLGLTQL